MTTAVFTNSTSLTWQAVLIIDKKKKNFTVKCVFCNHQFSGTVTRIRAHLMKDISQTGVKKCTGDVPEVFLESLKREHQVSQEEIERRSKKRKLLNIANQQTISSCTNNTRPVKSAIAEFFLAEAIPFLKVESPYFRQMLESISAANSTAGVPCRQTLASTLTDDKYEEVRAKCAVIIAEKPPCTLLADEWTTVASSPVCVWLCGWSDVSLFVKSFDTQVGFDFTLSSLEVLIIRMNFKVQLQIYK